MNLFKAADYEGNTLSVVLARSRELAEAYWQGSDIYPHSVSKIELLPDHPTGVVPVVTTYEVLSQDLGRKALGTKVRLIKK